MKNLFLSFILGAIVFGFIGVYAGTLIDSNQVSFKPKDNAWTASTVEGALNDLYTRASTYKNLNQTPTFTAADLVLGKTAYNKDGNLVTGTYIPDCIGGIYHHNSNTQYNIPVPFVPKKVILNFYNSNTDNEIYMVYNGYHSNDLYFYGYISTSNVFKPQKYDHINIGSPVTSSFTTSETHYLHEYDLYYTFCK